ncbi:protease complex subunit PrcB family protein [Marininema halotolerans]|uniref:PrcB C-terminal n=1 Tax=Marininema halotolerans TaxID=1155944 RepID=A0A1I6UJG4_9BACL|nr:protease complex subunit PrcB family protein [Marininema halotolerans]SFT01494.1 PrcB C-terminal [Marininema halotolerans]
MKTLRVGLTVLAATVVALGFNTSAFAATEKSQTQSHSPVAKASSFQSETLKNLPNNVKEQVNLLQTKQEKGLITLKSDGRTYIILSLGTRPSSGYQFAVEYFTQWGSKVFLTTHETTPASGQMVSPMITNPISVISVDGEKDLDVYWLSAH